MELTIYCQCDRCNSSYYGETESQLKVRSGEHIEISPLTFKNTEPSKGIRYVIIIYHVIQTLSFDESTILAHENEKYLFEIKESLLIKHDQPALNKNISSATFHLCNTILMSLVSFYCEN